MKKEIRTLEKIEVKNLDQLHKALEPFMKDTTIRKLLIEGMDVVKRQQELSDIAIADEEAFGGYMPARPTKGQHYHWVDTLIDRRMAGKRERLVIVWDIPEGKHVFNPWTQELKRDE